MRRSIVLFAAALSVLSRAQAANPICTFVYNYVIEFGPDAQSQPYNLLVIPSGCAVSVANIPSWATVEGPASGAATGNAALLTMGVSANNTALPRSGVNLLGDAFPAVVQNSASCTATVAPAVVSVPASGGSGTFVVTDNPSGCWLNVKSVPSWIVGPFQGQEIFQSPFTVSYTVARNTGPARSGTIPFVSDPSTSASITFNQAAVGPELSINTTALPPATSGEIYVAILAASGGVLPYTWTASGLAPGVILNSAGVLNGAPAATASGIYNLMVTVTDGAGAIVRTELPFLVMAASPTVAVSPLQLHFSAVQGGSTPAPQTISVTASGAASASFTAQVAGSSYTAPPSWLSMRASSGTTPATLTVTASQGTLPVGTLTGRILVVPGNQAQAAFAINVTFTITDPAATLPAISQDGVGVTSSFGGLKTVGPGTYVEIFGSNLSSSTTDWSQSFVNGVAPTTLEGVGVKINGEAAFVDYVSPGQINALLPADVSAGPGQLTVTNSLGASAPFIVNVAPQQATLLAPFTISGKQYAGALLGPDYATTFALPAGAIQGVPSRPVKPGETLVLYGLGLGPVTPNVPIGSIAPAQVARVTRPLQILIGQTPVTLDYVGLAPGFVSLYQINVQVPQIAASDAVPLTFTLGGSPGAQTLYIAVQQ